VRGAIRQMLRSGDRSYLQPIGRSAFPSLRGEPINFVVFPSSLDIECSILDIHIVLV